MELENKCIKNIGYRIDKKLDADLLQCFTQNNHILIFPCLLQNLSKQFNHPINRYDMSKFIIDREIFRSSEKLYPWFNEEMTIWFAPRNRDELIDILDFHGITYYCCIIPKGANSLINKIFTIHVYEHDYRVSEGEEYRSMFFQNELDEKITEVTISKIRRVVDLYNDTKKDVR